MRWDVDPEQQAHMLSNRVRKNHRHLRARFAKRQVEAYRLYDRDIPEIRLAIDWYGGHVVVAEYARQQHDLIAGWAQTMAAAVAHALGVPAERVHLKTRRTRPADGPRYQRLSKSDKRVVVREGSLRYGVNLTDFVDTGLYPDHRLTRAKVMQGAQDKDVLNLYGYTGSFTCAAAQGGAKRSVTVDRSGKYLQWAQDNMELNSLSDPEHRFVTADCRAFMTTARKSGDRFDVIVLDPPSFSTAGDDRALDVQRDHRGLVIDALALLRPGGDLWFSTNHQRFEPNLDEIAGVKTTEMTAHTVPEDFRNRTAHRSFLIRKA